jgi:hypothetical protein
MASMLTLITRLLHADSFFRCNPCRHVECQHVTSHNKGLAKHFPTPAEDTLDGFKPRARICKPLNELRNRFPAWRAGTTTLFDVHRLAESIPGFFKRLQMRGLVHSLIITRRLCNQVLVASLAGPSENKSYLSRPRFADPG